MSKILVIDDDQQICMMITMALEEEGFTVRTASDGAKGLKAFGEFKPDAVVTDIIMPEKEGVELIMELRRMAPQLKIVAISGGGQIPAEHYLSIADKLGADVCLAKPFDGDALVGAVRQVLG